MIREMPLSEIVIDPEVQARANGVVKAVVQRYAEEVRNGVEFPAVDVFGQVLADGFHRVAAYKLAGRETIPCVVHEGGKREAILFSVGANARHGVKRTNVDKQRSIQMILRDEEWSKRSESWIAEQCNVSRILVRRIRELIGVDKSARILGKDGRMRRPRRPDVVRERPVSRPDDINVLIMMTSERSVTLMEAADLMNRAPKLVKILAEEAGKRGTPVYFASGKDERADHAQRLRLRELNEAKSRLLEELRQKDVQLDTLKALKSDPIEPIRARRGIGEGKNRQGTPVLVMSDLHIEEKVTLEKTMGLNEYSPDIAKRCIERCAEAFEWFEKEKKHRWDMRQAIVAIIGDTFSGWIHAELVESNFMSPVRAVVWLQDELERMFKTILATTDFEGILVVLKDGNHGRLTQKIRASTRTENSLEWLMFHTLASRFVNEPRLRFQIDDSIYSYVDCYDRTIAFTHGDQFQYMGGIGGLLIPVRRGLNEARKYRPVDTFVMGHHHTYMPLDDVHVNGSMIGVTPYSLSKSIPPERRRQSYFLLDSANWKTDNCPIWLVKEPDPAWKNLPIPEE